MNCKPKDLAIVVVPADWPRKTLSDKIVEVVHFVPPRGPGAPWDQRPTWWCKFNSAWFNDHGVMFLEGALLDSWLRPIARPFDAKAIETEIINPLELALGITSRYDQ